MKTIIGFRPFSPFPTFFLASILLWLCSCTEESGTEEVQNQSASPIHEFTWETMGGGQVKFRVTPAGEGAFSVHVREHNFKAVGKDLNLTSADGEAYQVVKQIFDGTLDLRQETFTPRGATGSWTSITVATADGKSVTIKNISPGGRLLPLGQFIDTKLPGA